MTKNGSLGMGKVRETREKRKKISYESKVVESKSLLYPCSELIISPSASLLLFVLFYALPPFCLSPSRSHTLSPYYIGLEEEERRGK